MPYETHEEYENRCNLVPVVEEEKKVDIVTINGVLAMLENDSGRD